MEWENLETIRIEDLISDNLKIIPFAPPDQLGLFNALDMLMKIPQFGGYNYHTNYYHCY